MARYGWFINVGRCGYLDDAGTQAYNVNLVRPWSDAEFGATTPQGDPDERAPALASASAVLGTLPHPWMWSSTEWRVYAYLPNGDAANPTPRWNAVAAADVRFEVGTPTLLAGSMLDRVRTQLADELRQQTDACGFPFSRAVDDYWGRTDETAKVTARSHVHALAPLTHWPATASGALLRLSGFVHIASASLAGATQVACFPAFTFKRGDPPVDVPTAPILPAAPGGLKDLKKPYVVGDYTTPDLAFACLVASPLDQLPLRPAPVLNKSQGHMASSELQSLVVRQMLPLALLATWMRRVLAAVAADPDVAAGRPSATNPSIQAAITLLAAPEFGDAMRQSLWRSIGVGWEATRAGIEPINLTEWMARGDFGEDAPAVHRALTRLPSLVPADPEQVLKSVLTGDRTEQWPVGLAGQPAGPSWTDASVARWKTFLDWFVDSRQTNTPTKAVASWNLWLGAAVVLLSDDGMREILGPWLSFVQAPAFGTGPGQTPWPPGVRENLRTPGLVRTDLVARTRIALVSPAQWAAFSVIDDAPGFSVELPTLTSASLAAIASDLGPAAWTRVDAAATALATLALEPAVQERAGTLPALLDRAGASTRPRGRDCGIRLSFQAMEPDAVHHDAWDQQVRGYAIALCAGTMAGRADDPAAPWKPDLDRAQWITDTAMHVSGVTGDNWLLEDDGKNGRTAWMHDTVGSTVANGERVVWVEYHGHPLATALADPGTGVQYDIEGADGFKILDFGWRADERPLPLLAYGGCYRAVTHTIDNAGAIIEPELRSTAIPSALIAAHDVPDFQANRLQPSFQYLSSQPPGAPRVVTAPAAALFELSDETQAHAYQAFANVGVAGAAGAAKPVALLGYRDQTPGFFKPVVVPSCVMSWAPPQVHADFFTTWLNADRLLAATKSADRSDPNFANMADSEIADFGAAVVARAPIPYNPSVSAIGVEIYDPLANNRLTFPVQFDRTTRVGGILKPTDFELRCVVNAAPAGTSTTYALGANGLLTLTLAQGTFVRLRMFSLVDARHLDPANGTQARFVSGIELQGPGIPAFAGFVAFGPTEHWFEVMPAWNTALATQPVQLSFLPPVADGDPLSAPDLALLKANCGADAWVAWNKGLLLQRHEWHWTGYPVALPKERDVEHWLASFAGVESFREITNFTFATSFMTLGHGQRQWRIGSTASNADIVHRWNLPTGPRPARYAAFFARPLVRFAGWLDSNRSSDGPLQLQSQVFASGAIVPGKRSIVSDQRLPSPVPRWTIPLTANYWPTGGSGNGVLIVFDDVLRRTDDQARIGGIGETLEVDLLDTRIPGVPEIGLNPIIHPLAATGSTPITIRTQPPFGLTYDTGANPKVAQSAMVVSPQGAGGRWVMAKLRTRRLILPETELANLLSQADAADGLAEATSRLNGADRAVVTALGMQAFVIPMRSAGDDSLPMDIAIDLDGMSKGVDLMLHVLINSGNEARLLGIAVPSVPLDGDGGRRLLASWHKERWEQSDEPSWRCQVLLQVQRPGEMAWEVVAKASCFSNSGSQLPAGLKSGRSWLFVNTTAARTTTIRRVSMSDYTQPAWATFIGSFGSSAIGQAGDYRLSSLVGTGDAMTLWAASPDVAMPQLAPLDVGSAESRFHLALVFRPVRDLTRSEPEAGTGALVAAFMATGQGGGFRRLPLHSKLGASGGTTDIQGCSAYVITLQRTTALSREEQLRLSPATPTNPVGFDSFDSLLSQAFPDQAGAPSESLLRFLPEYLGPIGIS